MDEITIILNNHDFLIDTDASSKLRFYDPAREDYVCVEGFQVVLKTNQPALRGWAIHANGHVFQPHGVWVETTERTDALSATFSYLPGHEFPRLEFKVESTATEAAKIKTVPIKIKPIVDAPDEF